jgi:hypothetical protein
MIIEVPAYLALGKQWLDLGPCLALGSIAEEVHHNGSLFDGLFDLKEISSWYPAILNSILPRSTIFPNTNNNIQAIVAKVKALTMALRSVPNQSERIVFEELLSSSQQLEFHKLYSDYLPEAFPLASRHVLKSGEWT